MALYPYAREALFELVDGQQFAGHTAKAYFRLQTDFTDHLPAVLIYPLGGTEGYIDRVDRVGVEVYATGTDSLEVAEAVRSALVGRDHDTSVGYLDDVQVETVPVDVPYPDPTYAQTQMVLRVTTRPL